MSADLAEKPRRSALYVPVNNPRALAKAPTLDTDVIIYDFEDAILPDQKPSARMHLSTHLKSSTHQGEIVLRINPVNSQALEDDLNWLPQQQGIDALLLPKVRCVQEVKCLMESLDRAQINLPVWLLVETIDAVINLAELVDAMTPGSALVLGAEDLAREMHINSTPGRLGLLPILTQLVLYGRKAKLTIIDAIYPNIENELGFRQACEQARNLGFDGKSLIHPAQVDIANQQFSPSPAEIEKAEKIVQAWAQKPDHLGIVTVDGQVVEMLHVNQACEVLKFANHNKN